MAFLAENDSSHKHKDALWPSPGHDGPPGPPKPRLIPPYSIPYREEEREEEREDDNFARVHFYLEPGKDRRRDGIFARCANCGQAGHIKTNRKSVIPFPEPVCRLRL
jgi:hypothetical protein